MNELITELKKKVKDCNNTNTIFDTKKYVLLDDALKILNKALNILNKALNIHNVSNSVICKTCGDTGRAYPTLNEPDGIECPDCSSK